jgi:hypothetical protein
MSGITVYFWQGQLRTIKYRHHEYLPWKLAACMADNNVPLDMQEYDDIAFAAE